MQFPIDAHGHQMCRKHHGLGSLEELMLIDAVRGRVRRATHLRATGDAASQQLPSGFPSSPMGIKRSETTLTGATLKK